jgi:hypothetical protein
MDPGYDHAGMTNTIVMPARIWPASIHLANNNWIPATITPG